mmetsp:Transcript_29911/g.46902  ORF Transcript_29911/g.46902 Transcript_29911/m.46902 type:complete len:91 (+) Transcript_29911:528-800(+)
MEMNYFKETIPEYYEKQVVFKLTPEKKADQARHTAKQHGALVTISFGPKPMMVFISGGKKWKDEVKDIQYRTSQEIPQCRSDSEVYRISG